MFFSSKKLSFLNNMKKKLNVINIMILNEIKDPIRIDNGIKDKTVRKYIFINFFR